MKKTVKEDVTSELDTARNNFTSLLKKWNRKSNTSIHNYEDRNHYNSSLTSPNADYDDYEAGSPIQKYKRIKVQRKTKKRLSEDEYVQPSTCMLKLFDRTVDLAQFNDNTPLYALCRAWVKNPTNNEAKDLDDEEEDAATDQMNVDENEELIYELPAPEKAKRDLRIPKSVKKSTTSTKEIDKAINSLKNEKLEKLLEMNKKRWKEVRAEWRKASLENDKRYRKSWLIFKEMYDRTVSMQAIAIDEH